MCLNTLDLEAKVNISDLSVFKVMGSDNRSPFQKYQYEANVLMPYVEFGMSVWTPGAFTMMNSGMLSKGWSIEQGYHAYREAGEAIELAEAICMQAGIVLKLKVVKMTIPKGAKVFYGVRGDIVADRIFTGDLEAYHTCASRAYDQFTARRFRIR